MRTFKLQVQMTIDGYMAGPNGAMDWIEFGWTDDIKAYVTALTEPVDCIVLGRTLAEGFIPTWAAQPEAEGAEKFNSVGKVVISKTLTESPWANTVIAGDLVGTVNRLKAEFDKVIRVDLLMKNNDGSHQFYRAGVDQIDNHIPEKYSVADVRRILGLT